MSKSTMFNKIVMFSLAILVPATAIAVAFYPQPSDKDALHRTFPSVGNTVTDQQLSSWDISVYYDGENLPSGSGTLEAGEEIYQAQCAMCHGEFGEGAKGYPKMLGADMEEFIQTAKDGEDNVSIRGINNLWAHAPTLYDFIRRAMPFFAPQSLTNEQAYAVTGYVLQLAEVIDGDTENIDAEYLKSITMPSADNFYTDTRPDIKNVRCMENCYDFTPEIKGNAIQGDISLGSVDKREKS